MKIVDSTNPNQHLGGHLLIEQGDKAVRINIRIPHCPQIFPHQVSKPCEYCQSLYEEKRDIILDTWLTSCDFYTPPEAVPLKRRLNIAVTRFFNWIGSWSKN